MKEKFEKYMKGIPTPVAAFFGISAPAAGYKISLSDIEQWIRVASAFTGLLVCILCAICLAFKVRSKWRAYQWNKQHGYSGKEETSTV